MAVDGLESVALGRVLGDDPLAGVAVGDAVGGAEVVQKFLAAEAELCLERGGAVVDAGMDDLGVARRRLGARVQVALEKEGGRGALGEGARGG